MKIFVKPLLPLLALLAFTGCAYQAHDSRDARLALANSHLEMAQKTSPDVTARAVHYLASAAEAVKFLNSPADREAARLTYNSAVSGLVTLLGDEGRLRNLPQTFSSGGVTYQLSLSRGGSAGIWQPSYFTSFKAAEAVSLKNLKPNRQEGIGAALVGVRKMNPREPQTTLVGISAPVTALVDFKGTHATLTFINPTEKTHAVVANASRQLSADFTAPLAYYPPTSEMWNGVMGALRVDAHLSKTGLYMLQPYDPNRIPVIFVHGLISTPQLWRNVINEINGDPVLRKRYQCWVFAYPTGNPPAYSALRLREELATARKLHPGMKDFVLIGHSMGGIVSRMQATTFDQKAWEDALGREKATAFFAKAKNNAMIQRASLFKANPHVARLVFICTPHRGSEMALGHLGNLGRSLIALPADLSSNVTSTMGDAMSVITGHAGRLPNSVTGLSPTNPTLNVMDHRPIEAPYHSIIGDQGKGDSPLSSDGVVKYWSSHLAGCRSERIVPGPHSACELPETINELKRILRAHCQ